MPCMNDEEEGWKWGTVHRCEGKRRLIGEARRAAPWRRQRATTRRRLGVGLDNRPRPTRTVERMDTGELEGRRMEEKGPAAT
jgi:hypothetical protein